MRSYIVALKKQFSFTKKEFYILILYAVVAAFSFSFQLWGDENGDFSYSVGILNLLKYIIYFLIAYTLMFVSMKAVGIKTGVFPTVHHSKIGLALSLLITFLLRGVIPFFIPPGISMQENARYLLGRKRNKKGFQDSMALGMSGILLPLVIFSILGFFLQGFTFFKELYFVFLVIVIYYMIPFDFFITPFENNAGFLLGTGIGYRSRTAYVFTAIFVIAYSIMFFLTDALFSLIFGLLVAIIGGIYYNFMIEPSVGEVK